jgi:hypothetical protein
LTFRIVTILFNETVLKPSYTDMYIYTDICMTSELVQSYTADEEILLTAVTRDPSLHIQYVGLQAHLMVFKQIRNVFFRSQGKVIHNVLLSVPYE